AVRSLQAPTGPQGYDFIYLATSKRTPPSQIRKILTIFGINTKRIIGLLIHNSFKDELIATLAKKQLHPLTFNPLEASVIADPLYNDASEAEKITKATDIHHQRIAKICKNLKNTHLSNAIINYF
ncbi:hypothetical protein BCR42DRAFT_300192, partial [Absidia repens]